MGLPGTPNKRNKKQDPNLHCLSKQTRVSVTKIRASTRGSVARPHCHNFAQNYNGQEIVEAALSYRIFGAQNKQHCGANASRSFLNLGKV